MPALGLLFCLDYLKKKHNYIFIFIVPVFYSFFALLNQNFIVSRKIGKTNVVRLAGINAPEKYQFGGKKATNRLRGLIGGKTVTIVAVGTSYNRVVANVRSNRKSTNKRLR